MLEHVCPRILYTAILVSLLTGCVTTSPHTHELLQATLWTQTSLEYEYSAVQAYAKAREAFERARSDTAWTAAVEQAALGLTAYQDLPLAVVLDIDETVLDNSPFEARLILKQDDYNEGMWREWINEASAEAVPGAKEFIDYVMANGAVPIFITNRHIASKSKTLENLQKTVHQAISAEQVLCKAERPEWSSNKSSRRAYVAARYRILLLIGDDFNDFVWLGKVPPEQRIQTGYTYDTYWTDKWVLLPNCMYGSWEQSLLDFNYKLDDPEKREKKYSYLKSDHPEN